MNAKHLHEHHDFSLVLGGPLYQILRRAHLSGDALQLLNRRIVVLTLTAWLPLLLLSVLQGLAWGDKVQLPFLHDLEMHVRLLIALPLLIVAELVVNRRMSPVVDQFIDRGLIPDSERARFDAAVNSAMRWRNSVPAEIALLAFVYIVGVGFIWRANVALGVSNWHGVASEGQPHLSLAGWWLGCVSIPLFQFLLLRWYFRIVIWARFLFQVARLDLNLMPMHPDRCGGLGFLSGIGYAFSPLLFAQGAVVAGMIADRIFFAGAAVPNFKLELIGLVALMVFAVLAPLMVFVPKMAAAKRTGAREFGTLAQLYVLEFDRKWLRGGAAEDENLMGSADIQSLADIGNSFSAVNEMKFAPFTLHTIVQLVIATLLPMLPLLFTMFSVEEILLKVITVVL